MMTGIDMHWCTCMHWRGIEGYEKEASVAAREVMNFMNAETAPHRDLCQELRLKKIEDAKMIFPNEKV